jgi:hypothetical protein
MLSVLDQGHDCRLYFPEICSIFLPTFARKKWAVTTFIWAFYGFAGFEKRSKPKKSGLLPTFGN